MLSLEAKLKYLDPANKKKENRKTKSSVTVGFVSKHIKYYKIIGEISSIQN